MNSMLLKLATTQGTSLKVDSGDVSQGVADATKGVTDATQDAVNEVNQATQLQLQTNYYYHNFYQQPKLYPYLLQLDKYLFHLQNNVHLLHALHF